jgi:hypothetical protein
LKCTVREPLQKVGRAIEEVLAGLSVWELRDGAEEPAHQAPGEIASGLESELVKIEVGESFSGGGVDGGTYGK